jgi:hypothetical protein
MKKAISPCSSRGIVLHIAERHAACCWMMQMQERAIAWMFTAINTVELPRLLRPSQEEEARKFPHLTSLLH